LSARPRLTTGEVLKDHVSSTMPPVRWILTLSDCERAWALGMHPESPWPCKQDCDCVSGVDVQAECAAMSFAYLAPSKTDGTVTDDPKQISRFEEPIEVCPGGIKLRRFLCGDWSGLIQAL